MAYRHGMARLTFSSRTFLVGLKSPQWSFVRFYKRAI